MAVKDTKARRGAVNYTGGRIVGAIGLLEYLFGTAAVAQSYAVKVDAKGRRRLGGLLRRASAIGGKQIIIDTKAGPSYQLHYTGALVDWALHGATKLQGGVVNSWSTARGSKKYI